MNVKEVKNKIAVWFEQGSLTSNTHLIIIEAGGEISYRFVDFDEEVSQIIDELGRNPKISVVEVYNLEQDLEEQLDEYKTWNI